MLLKIWKLSPIGSKVGEIGLKKSTGYLFAIIAVIFWGTTFAVSQFVVPDPLDPITYTMLRTLLGFLFLVVYVGISGQLPEWWIVFKKHWKTFVMIGSLCYSIAYIIQYTGLIYTTATNQAVMANTQSFWVIFFNFLIFKKRPNKWFYAGLVMALVGISLIMINDQFQISQETLLGDLLSILAFALWGAYISTSKPVSQKEKSIFVSLSIFTASLVVLIPISITVGGIERISNLSLQGWLVMLYLGIFCIAVAFILWQAALSHPDLPSENIGLMTILRPVVGIITSIILLGEILTVRIVVGSSIVILAILLIEIMPRLENKRKLAA